MSVSTIFDASQSVASILLPVGGTTEVGSINSIGSITASGAITAFGNVSSTSGSVTAGTSVNAGTTMVAGGSVTGTNFSGTSAGATSTLAGPLSALSLTATTATPSTNTGPASLTAGLASLGLLTSSSLGYSQITPTPTGTAGVYQLVIGGLRVVWGLAYTTASTTTIIFSTSTTTANTAPFQSQIGLFSGPLIYTAVTPLRGTGLSSITDISQSAGPSFGDLTITGSGFTAYPAPSYTELQILLIGPAKF